MVLRRLPDGQSADICDGESVSEPKIWHGIIGNGQSLSVGFQAPLSQTTAAAPDALRLEDTTDEYDLEEPRAASLKLVPLTEPFRQLDNGTGVYPANIGGLTPHHAMARAIAHLHKVNSTDSAGSLKPAHDPYINLHSATGKGGALMRDIKKHHNKQRIANGENSYAAGIYEAEVFAHLAKKSGAKLQYDAIILTHGESDAVLQNHEYDQEVIKMQKDYAEDLTKLTGQTHDPILFLCQQNTCPPHRAFLPVMMDQMWRVQRRSHGKVICSGPKYQYQYAPGGLHLDCPGYDRLGEKYGQVYYQTVVQGQEFVPLSPLSAKLSPDQRSITVRFAVPRPPLRWDETLPSPHRKTHCARFWSQAKGFEVRDAKNHRLVVEDASINTDETSVTISLACDALQAERDYQKEETYEKANKVDRQRKRDRSDQDNLGRPLCKEDNPFLPLKLAYAMTQEGEGFGPGFCGGTPKGRLGLLCDSDAGPGLEQVLPKCSVQRGSKTISRPQSDGGEPWSDRALYDIVQPGGYTLIAFDGRRATLDRAWAGPSSDATELRVRHNQRNFCVAFAMDVESS